MVTVFLWPLKPVQNPNKKPVLSHQSHISIIIKNLGIYIIYQFYPIDLIANKCLLFPEIKAILKGTRRDTSEDM